MEKELEEMKKLKHKGKAVKVVKAPTGECDNCIFEKQCFEIDYGLASDKWEAENKLQPCYDTKVKYIYDDL